MPRPDTKTQSKVRVDVHPGAASPAQEAAWRTLWSRLITGSIKREEASEKDER
jgi:hypothetical protein